MSDRITDELDFTVLSERARLQQRIVELEAQLHRARTNLVSEQAEDELNRYETTVEQQAERIAELETALQSALAWMKSIHGLIHAKVISWRPESEASMVLIRLATLIEQARETLEKKP